LDLRNIKLITEFESLLLSEYLVGTELEGCKNEKLKESAFSRSRSLCTEWNKYSESQPLSLILKSLVMTITFWMLTSVSLRYFKVDWLESE